MKSRSSILQIAPILVGIAIPACSQATAASTADATMESGAEVDSTADAASPSEAQPEVDAGPETDATTDGDLGLCRGCAVEAGTSKPLVGAWYFDGWADESSANPHLNGKSQLLNGSWNSREPITGWYDDAPSTIETFSNWGSQAGLAFWAFEWFPGAPIQNIALGNYLASATAPTAMQFAVAYTYAPASDNITSSNWAGYCAKLTSEYFTRPSYVRIGGKALFFIYAPSKLAAAFASAGGLAAAVSQLRAAAHASSIDLELVSLEGAPSADVAAAGFDSYSQYSILPAPSAVTAGTVMAPAENPYSLLTTAGQAEWANLETLAEKTGGTYIPVVTTGWDNRPWGTYEQELLASVAYFDRDPTSVASFYASAAAWAWAHPSHNPNPAQPVVMLEAWNELGEGAYLVPTQGDGGGFLRAIAAQIPR